MKSGALNLLPSKIKRSLAKFGADLSLARRRRRLTVASMVERTGVSRATYLRLEKGDPTVSMGSYVMALFALGFGDVLADIIDIRRDELGLLLDTQRVPKRVRPKKQRELP